MDEIGDIMRKRLSIQHRGRNMIGSLALNEIKSYFKIKKIDSEIEDEILTGYVRHNKIFLKMKDQNLKIQVFKEKSELLSRINQKLSGIGYRVHIDDIIFK